jgi:hypothetical protein
MQSTHGLQTGLNTHTPEIVLGQPCPSDICLISNFLVCEVHDGG